MKQEQVMKIRKGEKHLVMMIRVAIARVIVVTMGMMRMTTLVIVKATIVKTMIAKIVAMIRANP